MDDIIVEGNGPLKGETYASGAKNAALPIIASSLLADGDHTYRNVPDLADVRHHGAAARAHGLRRRRG